jgi:protein-L-isoaspartate(D-aspartate) O-methyltransferase
MIKPGRENLNNSICSFVSERVYSAFKKVDRKLFVPPEFSEHAYLDTSIPLDKGSAISQPSLVAEMLDVLKLKGDERVLEVGTGSGYSSALLSLLSKEVYSIEINKNLAKEAKARLKDLGFENVEVIVGDGAKGFAEKAPFDVIVLTAAVADIPSELKSQLKEGGKMLLPVQEKNSDFQNLVLKVKKGDKFLDKEITPVRFVPLS